MPAQPSLKQLHYLIALSETGHFGEAARRAGISQPSLSVQIRNLEDLLGVHLFERGRGPVTITPAGREVLARARRVAEEVQGILDIADSLQTGGVGTIRLGTTPTIGPYLLPYVVAELHRKSPDLSLYIREGTPRHLIPALERGDHDLILTQLPVNRQGLGVTRLYREPLSLAVAADHPLASKPMLKGTDLSGLSILTLGPDYVLHDQIAGLCHDYGATLMRDYEGTSLDALRQMVAMGMGATFLPTLYVKSEIERGDDTLVTLPFRGRAFNRSIGLVWRESSRATAARTLMADAIYQGARESFADLLVFEKE